LLDDYSAYLQQTGNKVAKRDAGPRIQVWRDARDAYDHILRMAQPLDWETEPEARALAAASPAARRMVDNVAFVRRYLAEELKDAKLVHQLAQYILFRCEFAVSITSDQGLAVQVFRSQTGRGKVCAALFVAFASAEMMTHCAPPAWLASRTCSRATF
jgi:hypothetical protein